MTATLRKVALGAALAWVVLAHAQGQAPTGAGAAPGPAAAPAAAQAGTPPGFKAPALPAEGESNAARAKSQPGNNAPMWRAVRESGTEPGFTTLPGAEKGILIQRFVQYPGSSYTTAGEAWRQVRNRWIVPYGGALLVVALLTLALTYFTKGPFGGPVRDSGRRIQRFTPYERAVHWSVAGSFAVLGISGLVIAFGKYIFQPIIGSTLFGWLTYALKTAHNLVGPLFAVALVLMIVGYAKDNLPRAGDLAWLLKGGGLLSGKHIPSHRFNAGEKLLFWAGVLVLGLTAAASGLVMDSLVPGWGETRGQMQVAHIVHAVSTVLMMAMFFGHIYMGTVAVPGALDAMRTGYVDETWAQEHHELWYDDVKAGRIPAVRVSEQEPVGAAVPGSSRA